MSRFACSPRSSDRSQPGPTVHHPDRHASSMTTLPSISTIPPTATRPGHAHSIPAAAAGSGSMPKVVLGWRTLRRDAATAGPRGGDVRSARIEATLSAAVVTIRMIDGDRERSATVLPVRGSRRETPAGTLLEWWIQQETAGPACRLLLSPDHPPLLRGCLLDRIGIAGGTHDLEAVRIDPPISGSADAGSPGS